MTGYDIVVNCALHPQLMRGEYAPNLDIDITLADKCRRARVHYVMLSTRRAYGMNLGVALQEDMDSVPVDNYGKNKLTTELRVRDICAESGFTILRISNVYGFEPGRHTFFGRALSSLRKNKFIELDISPFVERDFIHVADCAYLIWRVLRFKPKGLYNIGNGVACPVGKIALWVIDGYEAGELRVTETREFDSFSIDTSRLVSVIGNFDFKLSTHQRCIEIGKRLKNE